MAFELISDRLLTALQTIRFWVIRSLSRSSEMIAFSLLSPASGIMSYRELGIAAAGERLVDNPFGFFDFRSHWISPMKKYSTDEGSKGGRPDLAAATKDTKDSGERIADALVIAQQKDPIFQDPRLVMLELTLAIHVLEAAS